MGKKKQVVFDPKCPFEVAKAVTVALYALTWADRQKAMRWALESSGWAYPVKIQGGSQT